MNLIISDRTHGRQDDGILDSQPLHFRLQARQQICVVFEAQQNDASKLRLNAAGLFARPSTAGLGGRPTNRLVICPGDTIGKSPKNKGMRGRIESFRLRSVSIWIVIASLILALAGNAAAAKPIQVWENQELTFHSARQFDNPYTDVVVWVDLAGPGFHKRVYGFWDGGNTFRVRLLATALGAWTWTSGSEPGDKGLAGKTGSFEASPGQKPRRKPTRCADISCYRLRTTTRCSLRMALRFSCSAIPGGRQLQIASAGTTMTANARSGPKLDSKTTCGFAKPRDTTGSTRLPASRNWASTKQQAI